MLGLGIQACGTLGQQPTTKTLATSTILAEAHQTASRITDLKLKEAGLGSVAIFQAIANDYRSAQETSLLIQDGPWKDWVLSQIGGVQARSGDIRSAKALATLLENGWAKERVESDIVISLATHGQFGEAIQVASDITDESTRTLALLNIVLHMAESGDFEGAERIAGMIPDQTKQKDEISDVLDSPTRSWGYAYIANRLVRKHRMSEALRVLQLMNDPVEQSIAVKTLIGISLQTDDYDQAQAILNSVTREQARTCGLIYLAMHYAGKGNIHKGLEIARTIDSKHESARCTHFPGKTLALDPITKQSFVLMAAVNGGHTKNAQMTAEGFSAQEGRDHARVSIAIAQARDGDPEGGLNTVSTLSTQHSGEGLKEIALAYAKAGMRIQGIQIANRIESKELREETLGQMVFNLALASDAAGALRILQDLPDEKDKKFAFIAIAEAQAASGNYTEALATTRLVEQGHDRAVVIGKVATIATQNGNVQDVLTWVRDLPNPDQRLYGLLGVAKALLARSGEKENTGDFPTDFR